METARAGSGTALGGPFRFVSLFPSFLPSARSRGEPEWNCGVPIRHKPKACAYMCIPARLSSCVIPGVRLLLSSFSFPPSFFFF